MKLNVLILEDRTTDAELVFCALRDSGFELKSQVVSDKAGFREALNTEWDLILADYSLPDYDAAQALNELRVRGLDIPLIIVSGTIGEETAVEAMKAGASDYLMKDRLGRLGRAVTQAVEQKRNRQEKLRAEIILRESEERFRQMAEHIEAVFWMTDPRKEQMLYISPAYETIWGRSCANLYASPQEWMEAVHPEDRDRIKAAAKEKQVQGQYDEEFRIVRPDGEIRWIRDRAFPIRDHQGAVYRVAGVAHDITDRLALEIQLRHSQRLEAVGQLAGGVAHELGSPLSVIGGKAQRILRREDVDADVRDRMTEIRRQVKRMEEIVNRLLEFGGRRGRRPYGRIGVEQIVREATASVDQTLEMTGTDLEVDGGDGDAEVVAEGARVTRAVANLLRNAVQASPGGRVRLGWTADGGEIRFVVEDDGPGIDPEARDHLFEPFFTTRSPGEGAGLGLAVVHATAEDHGGRVEVGESPLGGASVTLVISKETDR
jgi:PAS domain S-box-containing protein